MWRAYLLDRHASLTDVQSPRKLSAIAPKNCNSTLTLTQIRNISLYRKRRFCIGLNTSDWMPQHCLRHFQELRLKFQMPNVSDGCWLLFLVIVSITQWGTKTSYGIFSDELGTWSRWSRVLPGNGFENYWTQRMSVFISIIHSASCHMASLFSTPQEITTCASCRISWVAMPAAPSLCWQERLGTENFKSSNAKVHPITTITTSVVIWSHFLFWYSFSWPRCLVGLSSPSKKLFSSMETVCLRKDNAQIFEN